MKLVYRTLTAFGAITIISGIAVSGCSKAQLVRFAPPGIIKYEDLAGDQPQNSEIKQRIADRAQSGDQRFPVLSQTPSVKPNKASSAERERLIGDLEGARDDLDTAIEAEWRSAEAERASAGVLPDERDDLLKRIERDSAAAARERRDDIERGDDTP